MKVCVITGKTAYPSEGVAKSELAWFKMLKLHGDENANQIRYYMCRFCNMYHLTSKELREKKNETSKQHTDTD